MLDVASNVANVAMHRTKAIAQSVRVSDVLTERVVDTLAGRLS